MNECSIVVCSCDDYEDVWELFFCALRDNWSDCKYDIILNTESKKTNIKGVNTHNSLHLKNNDKWGERLISTLKSISSEYVVMLYDDYVLDGVVNQEVIQDCLKDMKSNPNIAAFYFTKCSPNSDLDKMHNKFVKISQRADYKLNSAPGIWNREKLISYLRANDTPWAWEYFGSYRAYKNNDIFYQVQECEKDIYQCSAAGGAIYRGKWNADFVGPLLEKYSIDLDMHDRGVVSNDLKARKRLLKWKVDFFKKGYDMISINVLVFVYRIFKHKINKKISK